MPRSLGHGALLVVRTCNFNKSPVAGGSKLYRHPEQASPSSMLIRLDPANYLLSPRALLIFEKCVVQWTMKDFTYFFLSFFNM